MKEKKVKILFEKFCWNAEKTAGFKLIVRQREAQPPQLGLLAMHTLTGDSGKAQWKNLDAGCFRSMIALRNEVEAALKKGEEIALAPAKAKVVKKKKAPEKEGDAKKDKSKAEKGKAKGKKAQAVDKHAHPSGKVIRRSATTGEATIILQTPA